MRYAIISDIHGNLAALEAVLKKVRQEKCDKIVCLGDIVGYGPFPNECIEIIKHQCDIVIIGNHDHAAIGYTSASYFNIYAKMAIEWTATELLPTSLEYLQGLPFQEREDGILFVHATPVEPEEWNYVLSPSEARWNFDKYEDWLTFVGHSHVAVSFEMDREARIKAHRDGSLGIRPDSRYIINVGSVGQPRDGNPASSFGVYDDASKEYTLVRQNYDISKTQRAMMERDLPYFLVERLTRGQ